MEQATGETRCRAYLFQRLSVAIQRGNAASVWVPRQPLLGTVSLTISDFVIIIIFIIIIILVTINFYIRIPIMIYYTK